MDASPIANSNSVAVEGIRTSRKGAQSRLQLIAAGERLFVEQGLEVATLGDVARSAGQRNKSAVNYYFGGREGLIEAIVGLRFDDAKRVRDGLLADHLASGAPTTLTTLVGAVVLPVARSIDATSYFGRFQAQYALLRGPIASSDRILPVKETMRTMLDNLDDDMFEARWGLLVDTYLMAVAHIELELHRGAAPARAQRMIDDMIRFISAGLAAPAGGQ